MTHPTVWLISLMVFAQVLPVLAQEPASRAEVLRQAREEKQRALKPYEPTGLESTMHFVEDRAVFLLGREGIYPKLGSLTVGSGFAYGVGYRDRIFERRGTAEVWAASSVKSYWAIEGRVTFPELANGWLFAEAYGRRREYPEEDYFGLGPDSHRQDQADFTLRGNIFGARAALRPAPVVSVGGGVEYLEPRIGPGKDDSVPGIEESFDDATAPGLSRQPDFVRTIAFVEIDYRQPRNARRGGWYRFDFNHFDDRDFNAYTFNRFDVDLRQFVGLLAERRVLAARVFLSTSDSDAGQQVPFYLMPALGGNDTLRGFRDYRFRGPHALLLQGEYRFEIWSGLDGALFYDAGKVANRRSDLNFSNLESDYGFGFRFNTDAGVVARVDVGLGSPDGKHLFIVFGGVF
jgi:Omp85 superfamily domain